VPPLTLYVEGYFTNVWDATCFVCMTEKQLEFSVSRALLRDGQGVPPALREHAAIGRIPALQHGELWITESLAIVEYLEDTFASPAYPRTLPADRSARARARQVMAWLRSDLWTLRSERPWQHVVYPPTLLAPLTATAVHEATELIALVDWLAERGELAEWSLAHCDLAFALMRLADSDALLSQAARDLRASQRARGSVRAYVDHARPPNPPPRPRS
jgi:glutathione S-transferase